MKGLLSWAQGGSEGGYDPRQKPVEVGERGLPNAEDTEADDKEGLIAIRDGYVGMPNNECTRSTVVNGTTLAVATWGHAHTIKLS